MTDKALSQFIRLREKEIQISRIHSQHLSVKHGINIIRPAFAGAHLKPTRLKRGHQSTGYRRLAAAACRCGDQYSGDLHRAALLSSGLSSASSRISPPAEMIYTGFCPVIM